MTVKELITALLAFDPDTVVVVPDNEPVTEYPDPDAWAECNNAHYQETVYFSGAKNGAPSGFRTANVVRLEGF